MARYQLDDPKLQTALDDLAAEDVKNWTLDDEQLATLARLLPPVRRASTTIQSRRPALERRAA